MKNHYHHNRAGGHAPHLNRVHLILLMLFLLMAALSSPVWEEGSIFHTLCGLAGWAAAPIVLFLAAEGFSKSPCRERFLLVCYLLHMAAQAGTLLLPGSMPGLFSGIVSGMFLTVFLLYFFGLIREGMRRDDGKFVVFGAAGLLLPAFAGLLSLFAPESPLFFLFPSPFLNGGGLLWPVLGVGFSFFMDSKQKTAACYVLSCSAAAAATGFSSSFMLPCLALLFALLPVLLYSGVSQDSRGPRHNPGEDGELFGKCPSDLFTISLQ